MEARILVVDDDKIWRRNIKRALKDKYCVDTAGSLKEAFGLLKKNKPYHMIITDIGLSKDETNTDGIDILKFAHESSSTTQTIAISGRAANVDEEQFKKEYHVLAYLDKEILSKDRESFVQLVDKGVAISFEAKEKEEE